MADLQLVSDDLGELQRQAAEFTPNKDKAAIGENILGLRLLCLYGLKGAAAYMEHAHVLGQYDNDIYAQYHKIMAWLGTWPADMNALLECSMEIGQMNFKVMSILDAGETGKYGHPTPTQVNVKATAGKCILISGHDLKDLYNLLEQTEGTGVNVYTAKCCLRMATRSCVNSSIWSVTTAAAGRISKWSSLVSLAPS